MAGCGWMRNDNAMLEMHLCDAKLVGSMATGQEAVRVTSHVT